MNLNHVNYKQYENNYNTFHFTKRSQICDYVHTLAKSKVSREKLNYLTLANDSTPQNRAFFVRNIRTPQEFADFVLSNLKIHSMVERNGQSLTGCLPMLAVSHPVTFYRPTVRSLAVDSENLTLESTRMYQFIFALICAPQLKIRLLADNEQQARSRFTDGESLLLVGRINQKPLKNNRTLAVLPTLSVSAEMEVAHA